MNPTNKTPQLTEVPNHVHPAHPWLHEGINRDAIRAFLSAHDLDIGRVRAIAFTEAWFEATCLVVNERGTPISEGHPPRPVTETHRLAYLPGFKPKIKRPARPR